MRGGGGSKPFGIFPKNHPIWQPDLSLKEKKTNVSHFGFAADPSPFTVSLTVKYPGFFDDYPAQLGLYKQ